MPPLVSHRTLRLPDPSDTDRRAYDQRLRDALGREDLEIPLSVLRTISGILRKKGTLSCAVGHVARGCRLIDADAGSSFSLALDIGSTNLVALLYDNVSRAVVTTRTIENPQTLFGSDILTRMHHAMGTGREQVYDALRDGVNELGAEESLRVLEELAALHLDPSLLGEGAILPWPAEAVGLNDRGEIAVGKRADLIHVHIARGLPIVRSVWRAGLRVA